MNTPNPITEFLTQHGLADATLIPLASDASARQYFRIADKSLLLMDDHFDPGGFAAFIELSDHLNALGLSAPRVHAADKSHCLALVEDFGESTYASCLADGQDEAGLYALAIDAMLHLHHQPMNAALSCVPYDMRILQDELTMFSDWFAPAIAADGFDQALFADDFRALWQVALSSVANRREALVLRDFHKDNLMLLPKRDGVARCGLLDFQDALIGASEYDLVSLLQDARRDLMPGLEGAMLERYIANAPAHLGGAAEIKQRYAILGAQRHARILGTFVRLHQRDGKSHYLQFLPRVARQLDQALTDAGLEEIAALLEKHLPDWQGKAAALAV